MFNVIASKKAMTLPEIIVVVLLVSVVIGAGITPFIMQQSMLRSQMARSNIQDQVSIAQAYINKDIFKAEEISAIAGNSITIGIGTDLVPGSDEDIIYNLSGTDLQRNGITIATNITDINFTRLLGDNLVEVTITASEGTQDLTSSTAVALRATRA